MEARVDIRKLQLLNDRITQTIDALNQVRWSVHGLQHATGGVPNQGSYAAMQQPLPLYGQSAFQQPFGVPQQHAPWHQQAYGQQIPTQSPYATQGLGHSPFVPQAFGQQSPFASMNPLYGTVGVNGVGMNGIGIQHSTATPYGAPVVGFGGQLPIDIDHRVMEARANDPYLLSRTFPQAFGPTFGW